ncbi:hypothetical protein PC111_g4188 [Phytophthora cactorum]|nr:hypothetical protein PC111_g4188 [Phytophthora cactorum]
MDMIIGDILFPKHAITEAPRRPSLQAMSGPAVLERGGYCDAAPFLPGLLRSTVSGMAPARREWDYLQCGRLLLRTTRCRQGHGLRSLLKALLAHFPDLVFADSAGGIKLVIENSPTEHETRPGGMLFKSSGIIVMERSQCRIFTLTQLYLEWCVCGPRNGNGGRLRTCTRERY